MGMWSLTVRKEDRLREFENEMLMRIFGPKCEKGTSGLKKFHNEELNNMYSLPYIIRTIKSRVVRLAVDVACIEEKRNAYEVWCENL
jgi:hypothetical protein